MGPNTAEAVQTQLCRAACHDVLLGGTARGRGRYRFVYAVRLVSRCGCGRGRRNGRAARGRGCRRRGTSSGLQTQLAVRLVTLCAGGGGGKACRRWEQAAFDRARVSCFQQARHPCFEILEQRRRT